jgi:hypothetical protein
MAAITFNLTTGSFGYGDGTATVDLNESSIAVKPL